MSLVETLDRWAFIHHTARCPTCGEPVHGLTDGTYLCERDHRWISKKQLDGDVRWWHGTMPMMWMIFLIMFGAIVLSIWRGLKNLLSPKRASGENNG